MFGTYDELQSVNFSHPIGKGLLGWWLCDPRKVGIRMGWLDMCRNTYAGKISGTPPSGDTLYPGDNWCKARANKPVFKSTTASGSWNYGASFNPFSAVKQFSFGFWSKKRLTSSPIAFGTGASDYQTATGFAVISSTNYFYCSNAGAACYGGFADAQTNWTHTLCVFDGNAATNATRMKYYKNGVAQTLAITGTVPAVTRTYNVAASSYFSLFSLTGVNSGTDALVDDIKIWNRALSATEVTNVYNNSLLGFPGLLVNRPTPFKKMSVVGSPYWWNTYGQNTRPI